MWVLFFFLPFVQGLNRDLILKIQIISSIGITFALLGVIGTIVNTRRVGECRWAGLLTCISLLISGNMITCNIFVRVSYFLQGKNKLRDLWRFNFIFKVSEIFCEQYHNFGIFPTSVAEYLFIFVYAYQQSYLLSFLAGFFD